MKLLFDGAPGSSVYQTHRVYCAISTTDYSDENTFEDNETNGTYHQNKRKEKTRIKPAQNMQTLLNVLNSVNQYKEGMFMVEY